MDQPGSSEIVLPLQNMGIEKRLKDLEETGQNMERNYTTRGSKIQTVPWHLRQRENYDEYYFPKVISIGPIHHGDPKLKDGEQYKLMWASMHAKQNQQALEVLYKRVKDKIEDLRELFWWDKIGKHYSNEDLAFMLFVDGCSVIQILESHGRLFPARLNIHVHQLNLMKGDLMLLENQLPYKVLELLVDDQMKLKTSMLHFCMFQNMFRVLDIRHSVLLWEHPNEKKIIDLLFPPIHLLGCLHWSILTYHTWADHQAFQKMQNQLTKAHLEEDLFRKAFFISQDNTIFQEQTTYRTTQELKAAAIQIKRQKNVNLRDISFSSSIFGGQLHLPPIILEDSTVPTLLNLIAYEMCPDHRNPFDISTYVKLLDMLIDRPGDVKELRKAGILQNLLGSDEEVSKLFNTIGFGLMQNHYLYFELKQQMERHYKKRLSIWIAEAYFTQFRSPWTIIALLAATILLILTFIQTWNSFGSKQ